MAAATYNAQALTALKGLDAVRIRPGMYIGTTDSRGLQHCAREIIDNATDEAIAGFCTRIEVVLHADASVEVIDNGRGIPVDVNPVTGKPGVIMVMTELHAGGKFGSGDGYKVSGGLHGVGASAVNALSSKMEVVVDRGGKRHLVTFVNAVPGIVGSDGTFTPSSDVQVVGPAPKVGKKHRTGTSVRFWPDMTIFEPGAVIDPEYIRAHVRQVTALLSGVTMVVRDLTGDEPQDVEFSGGGGVLDLIDMHAPDAALSAPVVLSGSGSFKHSRQVATAQGTAERRNVEDEVEVQVAFRWGDRFAYTRKSYVNLIETAGGGTHVAGFERALTKTVLSQLSASRILRQNEGAAEPEDVKVGLTAVVAVKVPEPQFESQTKEKLATSQVASVVAKVVSSELEAWFANPKNKVAAKAFLTKVADSARARWRAIEDREHTQRKSTLERTAGIPEGFLDCRAKGVAESELLILEGNSALGSAKPARDALYQALIPVRGKIKNVWAGTPADKDPRKAREAEKRMLKNRECVSLITVIGAGYGADFDLAKMRYGRVLIATDADYDGSHIRVLLLSFFLQYMRPMLEAGRVYALVPPLYKLTLTNGEVIYCYSEEERTETLASLAKEKKSVKESQRYKGLGEMNAPQLRETTLDRSSRKLRQITVDDAAEAVKLFDLLVGGGDGEDQGASGRWNFIVENSDMVPFDVIDG